MTEIKTKHCTGCEKDLPTGEFNKDRSKKDGLACRCRKCESRRGKKYRADNREKIRRSQKEYRETEHGQKHRSDYQKTDRGREIQRLAHKKHYGNNRDKILSQNKKYATTEKGREVMRRGVKKYCNTLKGHLRRTFHNMDQRCNNLKATSYKYYGGRGIQNKFQSPEAFINYVMVDLGVTHIDQIRGLQVDRINNDGHYEPGNIRFATASVNTNNRRCSKKVTV